MYISYYRQYPAYIICHLFYVIGRYYRYNSLRVLPVYKTNCLCGVLFWAKFLD